MTRSAEHITRNGVNGPADWKHGGMIHNQHPPSVNVPARWSPEYLDSALRCHPTAQACAAGAPAFGAVPFDQRSGHPERSRGMEKSLFRPTDRDPRNSVSSVSCAAVTLQSGFTAFAVTTPQVALRKTLRRLRAAVPPWRLLPLESRAPPVSVAHEHDVIRAPCLAPHLTKLATMALRRDVVPIARIECGFANILQAQNLSRQTFEADREATVRRHSQVKHPQMTFE
jgi:hypothetical protein